MKTLAPLHLLGLLLLVQCRQELPTDKGSFVGVWVAPDTRLEIHAAGTLDYERHGAAGSVGLRGGRMSFDGSSILAGFWACTTIFTSCSVARSV